MAEFQSSLISFLVPVLILTLTLPKCSGQSYSDVTQLFRDTLGNNSDYNPKVRPLIDQSQTLNVSVNFDIVSILDLDDRTQKFVVNGFFTFSWSDELTSWNPANYNNIYSIHPDPKDIFRPRVILVNTLEDRDLFEDDYSPLILAADGQVFWYPGSLFPTSCKLNLRKYPFDTQVCEITMFTMGWLVTEIRFFSRNGVDGSVGTSWYVSNGEWDLTGHALIEGAANDLSFFRVEFYLARRPGFFIMNIVLPVVLMSFLNIMVFLIPVESGEKISYGITVLLALAVFVSIISGMLPRSSDIIPLVTVYLLLLLIISVATVLVSIVTVWLHHKDEKETKRQQVKASFKNIFKKVATFNRATAPLKVQVQSHGTEEPSLNPEEPASKSKPTLLDTLRTMRNLGNTTGGEDGMNSMNHPDPEGHDVNRYRVISRHIDQISFITFMVLWILITFIFMLILTS